MGTDEMDRERRDMMVKDEMYKEIQRLRETIFQLKKYGEELIEVKSDHWFNFSRRSKISYAVGRKILLIIRGTEEAEKT